MLAIWFCLFLSSFFSIFSLCLSIFPLISLYALASSYFCNSIFYTPELGKGTESWESSRLTLLLLAGKREIDGSLALLTEVLNMLLL